jgi:dipeptide/tripeptide permease
VWERFSFLGMQAILVLHFADTVTHGGTGMSSGTAASVSAAYGTLVFLLPVAGGRLADRILGSFRAALWGGPLIARGHSAMAVPTGTMMSATTKLAPAAFSSRTMSFWFPSRALANGIQAQTVKPYDDVSEPAYFAEATGVTP